MSEEKIIDVLTSSGLTTKEAEVYIFLAKHNLLKGTEIAKLMKMDKAHVFHVIERLKIKGYVESTLEYPTRYTVVPFENILESIIKAKREEVDLINEAKSELISHLKNCNAEPGLEKFIVIKGNKRIYAKIQRLIQDSRNQLSVAITVQGLMYVNKFGILDLALNHPSRNQIKYRCLAEVNESNFNVARTILKRLPINFKLKAINSELGLSIPRMIIRDNEELLFFITSKTEKDDVCLWTNCKSIVQAFTTVFEGLWHNSTDIQEIIEENTAGKLPCKARVYTDAEEAEKKYAEALLSAEKEIVITTTPEGLIEYGKSTPPFFKELEKRGVAIRILAPIVNENKDAAEKVSQVCGVRHIPLSYLKSTIIDGKHFFQFKPSPPTCENLGPIPYFQNTFYTNDQEYIEKIRNTLNEIWKNSSSPTDFTIQSALAGSFQPNSTSSEKHFMRAHYRKIRGLRFEQKQRIITEKDVLNKIFSLRNTESAPKQNLFFKNCGSVAGAIIHPPESFQLPEIVIQICHIEYHSLVKEENFLVFSPLLETATTKAYLPTTIVSDNPKAQIVHQTLMKGTPAENNINIVRKDELQILVHGNTLFAGWTKQIPLSPMSSNLPPACILFEGYGNVKTMAYNVFYPSGFKIEIERNGVDAFVTFFHPKSKYSGSGTDGFFARDFAATIYHPYLKRI